MTDSSFRLRLLFDKYSKKQCTPAELEELTALLTQADANDVLTEPMKELWLSFKEDKDGYQVDWEKMYANVRNTGHDLIKKHHRGRVKRMWMSIAAAVILIFCTGGYLFFTGFYQKDKAVAAVPAKKQKQHSKTQTIYLPDGSTVILNEGSKLNYPSAFNGRTREVYLSGEGYFDIKHDPSKMFMVHAGRLTAKVLGTAFNIKAFPAEDAIEVTVTRGKVQVMNDKKSVGLLTANHQITFNKSTDETKQKTVDAKTITNWKPEEILFDDITMEAAADRIEKRFNMTVDFKNPAIKKCRVSATFSEDDMADEILSVICSVSNADYTIVNNKIIIYGKGCN